MRTLAEVVKSDVAIKPLELGDWIVVTVNLQEQTANFTVWPVDGSLPSSAGFVFGPILARLQSHSRKAPKTPCGYFGCVVKNTGVTVTLGS